MVGALALMFPAHSAAGTGAVHAAAHGKHALTAVKAVKPAETASAAAAPVPDTLILDRGLFPGIDVCQAAAQEAHATGWMVYIGGPSLVFDPWPQQSAEQLIRRGFNVLPVYAAGSVTTDSGASQGAEAAGLAKGYSIQAGSPIMLDVEPEVYRSAPDATVAYIRDWDRGVRKGGYRPSTYSTADGLAAVAALGSDAPDTAVVASYPRPNEFWGPPSTASAPISAWPQARGWQFTNEVIFGGVNVDATSVNFPLAGAPHEASEPWPAKKTKQAKTAHGSDRGGKRPGAGR